MALLVAVVVALVAGVQEELQVTLVVAVTVLLAGSLALVLDQFGGVVVGIGAAAMLTGGRQLFGLWDADDFALALLQVASVASIGWLSGRVGAALRAVEAEAAELPGVVEPVFGSLGLLDADTAMARLDEEVERARQHGRALTLVLLALDVRDTSLDTAARSGALRAVARLVESRIRDADVPFALAHEKLGLILPETDGAEALEPIARVLDGVTTGRFAVRGEGEDRLLADTVEVRVGTARLDAHHGTAALLVDAANEALGHAPRSTSAPVPWLE